MGGYDFPGSTSCEDLHVLTGWIPERVGFKDPAELDKGRLWERLESGNEHGDCLITTATRELTEDVCESLGLVKSHAYAILRVERVDDRFFCLLKNPWAKKRWKGRFSAEDSSSWTPKLKKALGYDPSKDACRKGKYMFAFPCACVYIRLCVFLCLCLCADCQCVCDCCSVKLH